MSDIDPKKLKVAELREELKARGLDAKGNKPQLVKRLEKAIAAEAGGEVAEESCDASMLDTSALDSTAEDSQLEESQQEESQPETEAVQEEQSEDQAEPQTVESENEQGSPEPNEAQVEHEDDTDAVQENPEPETDNQHQHDQSDESEPDQNDNQSAECDEPNAEMAGSEAMVEEPVPEVHQEQNQAVENEPESDVKEEDMKPEVDMEEKPEATSEATEPEKEENEMEQGEGTSDIKNEPDDNAEEAGPNPEAEYQVMDAIDEADAPESDQKKEDMKEEDGKDADDNDRRGTKRRHSRSRSRDRGDRHHRSPRRRSRSRSRSRSARRRSRSRSHGRDRRRSASGERRRRSRSYEQKNDANKAKEIPENEDWLQETKVVFDRFNCDLNMRIDEAGYKGSPITVEGFAFMWSGVRTNYGVSKGKVAYEVKILNHLNVDHLPEEETSRHVVRVGWSTDSTSTQLGEEKFSYGYGGTGKASEDCKFRDYGESFEANDVITACVDFENDGPILISYMKNGNDLGTCFEIDRSELGEQALFPHILSKNCEFEINVGQLETPMFPLTEGFTFINDVPVEDRVRGTLPPSKKEDCEIIMMCGLPAAGKTVWAGKKAAEEPDKKYNVLGTNNIIDKMKVMGLPRKKNYAGRWDVLIDKATKCLTRMLEIAAKKKRNYVVDQTNVYPSAQRRKMRPFEGFQRKAVVIVPNDEEYKKRRESQQKEEGKDVPDDAILEMKANFALPEEGPTFDKVEFIELQREEAQKLVEEYNKEGQAVFPPDQKRWRRDDRFGGRDFRGGRDRYNNRDGGRGGSYNSYSRDRGYYNSNNNDRRGGGGGYRGYNDRKGGSYNRDRGYGNRDRYDSRDRNRRDDRSGSRDYRSNYSGGSGSSWNKNNQGSWGGGNQGSWGGNQGSWGNQQGWGQQGWGQQGYNQGWGNQWGNYNQGTTPAAGQQSGWGQNYNYWNQQPQQQGAWGQQSSTGYTAPSTGTQSSWYGNQSYGNYPAK